MLILPELISAKPPFLIYHLHCCLQMNEKQRNSKRKSEGNVGWVNVSTEWLAVQRWRLLWLLHLWAQHVAGGAWHPAGQLSQPLCMDPAWMRWIMSSDWLKGLLSIGSRALCWFPGRSLLGSWLTFTQVISLLTPTESVKNHMSYELTLGSRSWMVVIRFLIWISRESKIFIWIRQKSIHIF